MRSIWRFSHLTLALSSALFIAIASLTGIILALEPISNHFKAPKITDLHTISIAETVDNLQSNYNEIISVSVDENSFVKANVITKNNSSDSFYINPKTGLKIESLEKRNPIFEFTTNLHRSLFLKSTGRFLVGFFSFLFLLLAIAGFVLLLQRQGGFKKLFTKTIKEDNAQFYHVVFSKYAFLPIVIVAITGVYLSLETLDLLPKTKEKTVFFENNSKANTKELSNFTVFNSILLDQVTQLDFPFSSDKEDYFYLKLKNKELTIHQYSGAIVSERKVGFASILSNYSIWLHTGRGTFLWAVVLLLTCFAICYFIYSGFVIFFKRKQKTASLKNTFTKDNAEFILLIGSETGSTNRFANAFFRALLKANKTVFVDVLNNYTTYKKAKHIVVFTATYGDGEAPANATRFLKKVAEIQPKNNIQFATVGFGSKKYPEFCKYAILVNATLQIHKNFIPILPLFTVDNQSKKAFKKWVLHWSNFYKIQLVINDELLADSKKKQVFKVVEKSALNTDDTFTIQLKPKKKLQFTSGDVLSVLPNNKTAPRLYSIAKIKNTILISVKKHEFGVCSNFINNLKVGGYLKASIQKNDTFHFPEDSKEVLLIANGTGIAPFLGMIKNNPKTKIHLFLGVRNKASLPIYKKYINFNVLETCKIAFSRENSEATYVQDCLIKHKSLVKNLLSNNGSILICGSLAMQKEVFVVLESIEGIKLSTYINNKQIKTDCY